MHATRSVASNPIVRYVADALRFYMEFHARYDGFYGAFIHDPLAVAAALDRSLVTTEAWYVDVETRGELTTGMTVADRRRLTGKPPNLDVAVTRERPRVPRPPRRTRRRTGGGPLGRVTLGTKRRSTGETERRGAIGGLDGSELVDDLRGRPDRGLHPHDPGRLPRRPARRRRPVRGHRASVARPDDRGPDAHAGRHRDQHRGRLDRGRTAPADLSRLDRDRARRRPRRAVGRCADRHPVEPHLVDPAGPRRRRADGRLLRAGRRRHRPDGRVLGEPRRLPAAPR